MIFRVVIFVLIVLIELYFLQAVKTFMQDFGQSTRTLVMNIAYVLMVVAIAVSLASFISPPPQWPTFFRYLAFVSLVLVLCKFFGVLVMILDDLIRLGRWIVSKFSTPNNQEEVVKEGISRLKFMSQIAITLTVIPAIGFIYGIFKGAYNYKVHRVKVPSSKIPDAFNGFKIVQLSDIHVGSFNDTSALNRAFDIVMQQKPDLILFTGDLVNNHSDETNNFTEVFSRLKAPHGVYSVLGNHDYGDYIRWDSDADKKANLARLKSIQAQVGWRLLMNEHVAIEKEGEKIALLGIENWSNSDRFPKYGKMPEAHSGTEQYPFKILMSHDPSHWEAQVQPKYSDVDLTLSGHTHGMQMGIEIPGLRWSPSQYIYKQWAGLYKAGEQFLYVNRGLGFLGYPGRIGIWPEITVLELQKV